MRYINFIHTIRMQFHASDHLKYIVSTIKDCTKYLFNSLKIHKITREIGVS